MGGEDGFNGAKEHAPLSPTKVAFAPTRRKNYTIMDFRRGAEYLRSRTSHRPRLGVILGSGMSEFINSVEGADTIPYAEVHLNIPDFPTCSVSGHQGAFVVSKEVFIMSGRFHLYEVRLLGHRSTSSTDCAVDWPPVAHLRLNSFAVGHQGHSSQAATFPVRIMKEFGIEVLLITNAGGGLTRTLEVGDIMLIRDHFNTGWGEDHPLVSSPTCARPAVEAPCGGTQRLAVPA